MKTDLSQDQIDRYRRDGFLSYPGFLDPSEVDRLKAAVLKTVESMGNKKVAQGRDDMQAGDSYYDNVFTQRLNLWMIDETVKKFMLDSELGRMMCELSGVDGYRVWHDQALIKEPYGNPTGWHLDNPYWSFHSRQAISVWIALEPATLQNGCMYFVPGTHEMANFDNANIGEKLGTLFEVYPQMGKVDTVAVPMQPGDCSFHNGLTAHGAGANMTRGRRVAMTCAYMPVGSTFNGQQNILPDELYKSYSVGDIMEDDRQNPVVYERTAAAAG